MMTTEKFDGLPAGERITPQTPRVEPLDRRSVPSISKLVLALIRRSERTSEDFGIPSRNRPLRALITTGVIRPYPAATTGIKDPRCAAFAITHAARSPPTADCPAQHEQA